MKINNLLKLPIAIGVAEVAGIVGSLFTVSAIPNPSTRSGQAWYSTLEK